jgi:hypothetical protein
MILIDAPLFPDGFMADFSSSSLEELIDAVASVMRPKRIEA